VIGILHNDISEFVPHFGNLQNNERSFQKTEKRTPGFFRLLMKTGGFLVSRWTLWSEKREIQESWEMAIASMKAFR